MKTRLGIELKAGKWFANLHTVVDGVGCRVAECPPYGAGIIPMGHVAPWHSAHANARLIAISPEMFNVLARLQSDLEIFQTEDTRHLTSELAASYLDEIGAILAKT
jgi:hypothetical protein